MSTKKFKEDVIEFLKPRDAVRRRWGMYISDNTNANVLLREIIDNSADEISAGYGNTILINNNFNGYCFVADNGRGIPIGMSSDKPGSTQAYLSISELHSGSKFNNTDKSRVGMNGVGSSAVNFLSAEYWLLSRIGEHNYNTSIPEVKDVWEKSGPRVKKKLYYLVKCEKGKKVLETAGTLSDIETLMFRGVKNYEAIPEDLSTMVFFKPDPEIFESTKADIPIKNLQYFMLIQEKFYGNPVNIYANGTKINNSFKPYKFELIKTITPKDPSFNKEVGVYMTFEVDPSLSHKEESGSVNGLEVNQGQHISIGENCFKTALKDIYKIKHEYLTNGLQMCIVILAGEVMFDSQTKTRLKSISKVKSSDFVDVVKEIEKIIKKNPEYWDVHVSKLDKLAESMKDIGASEIADKIMNSSSGVGLYRSKSDIVPGFVDATGRNRMDCELYLCEGLSASGSLVTARPNTSKHAVLGLRGKILNVTDVSAKKALESQIIYSIFKVIGLGLDVNNVVKDCTSYEEAMEVIQQKSRYGKIVIATDADSDGNAIANELLYLFSKFARFMIDLGLIYRAISPLWRGKSKSTGRITYYYPDDPCNPDTGFPLDMDEKAHYARYKGLGSLSPETGEVEDIFFNEDTRRLIRITPEGLEQAMRLNEDIKARKELLFNRGVLSNPYNFTDL